MAGRRSCWTVLGGGTERGAWFPRPLPGHSDGDGCHHHQGADRVAGLFFELERLSGDVAVCDAASVAQLPHAAQRRGRESTASQRVADEVRGAGSEEVFELISESRQKQAEARHQEKVCDGSWRPQG